MFWELDAQTILHVVLQYTIVKHSLSFYYVVREPCEISAEHLSLAFEETFLTKFTPFTSQEISWVQIILTPSSKGVYKRSIQAPQGSHARPKSSQSLGWI